MPTSAPPHTTPPVPATIPGGSIARADIVRLGRSGSPWDYIPVALAALRVMPGDDEVRFLLAAAYARVGLKTVAIEQLDRMGEPARTQASAATLRQAIAATPEDRVSLESLAAAVRANVLALNQRRREPVDLSGHVEAWSTRADKYEHFRTTSGEVVWRMPGDSNGWIRLSNQAEQARAVRLPHDERPTAAAHPPWYIVEGIDPPWIFRRVFESTSGRQDGYLPLVIVLQRDVAQFVDGLAQADFSSLFRAERTMVLVGEDTEARLASFLNDRAAAGVRVASVAIGLPTTVRRTSTSPQQLVNTAASEVMHFTASVRNDVERMYASRDRGWFAGRLAEPAAGNPRRVLIITSRYSTFLRHSAADLATGFETLGCQTRVVMEPDDHSLTDPLHRLLALREFQPDLVVVPNYLRRDLAESIPGSLPIVTWAQDAMPHLYDAAAGASVGPSDFVVGNLVEDLFQKFAYPRGRSLAAPMAASELKFHAEPVSPEMLARHACEIAYVSHHSETPEAMLRRKREEAGPSNDIATAMESLLGRVREIVDRPIGAGPLTPHLRAATIEELGRAGVAMDDRTIAAMLTTLTLPLADRVLRHRTLEWAAAIAREKGWRMHLYGKGWERHPTLASFAKGELSHDDELRCCYQAARVHLHVSLHTAVHQRVFECALSGGLPICCLMADDLSHLEYLAAAKASRLGPPAACDPWRRAGVAYRFFGYRLEDSPDGRKYLHLCAETGLNAPALLWLNEIHAKRLALSPDETIDGDGRSLWDLWPDPGAVMFHDRDSLERVLVRAMDSPAWRRGSSEALAARARQMVTYSALARSVIGLVSSSLAAPINDGGRWYDARLTGKHGGPSP